VKTLRQEKIPKLSAQRREFRIMEEKIAGEVVTPMIKEKMVPHPSLVCER